MRLLLLLGLVLALAPAAGAATWSGTWAHDRTGTSGGARLVTGRETTLQLDPPAFGCAQRVVLPVRLAGGRVSGSGRDLPCNRGLRWKIRGRAAAAVIELRLPDGSTAQLRVALRRR